MQEGGSVRDNLRDRWMDESGLLSAFNHSWSLSVISKFNGTSTPKKSYSAKTGLICQVTSWTKSSNEQGNAHYGPRPAKVAG